MSELFPIVGGIALGALSQQRRVPFALRLAAMLVLGVAAAVASGELQVSWVFALLDAAQVALGAIAGAWLAIRFAQWRMRHVAAVGASDGSGAA